MGIATTRGRGAGSRTTVGWRVESRGGSGVGVGRALVDAEKKSRVAILGIRDSSSDSHCASELEPSLGCLDVKAG